MKIIGIIIALIVALFIAAIVALTLFFDPNDYRDDIARYVNEQTGRELSIEGDLSLSYFPWIGIEIGKVSLSNAPGFADKPFAQVERAGVAVEVMPLLRQELVMDRVILDGLHLNLARNQQGVGNWEDLAKSEPKPEPEPEPEEGKPALASFDISGVRVSDAQIEWDDRQSGTHIQLRDLNLSTGRLGGGGPVPVELSFDFLQGPEAPARHFEMEAEVDLNLEQGNLAVNDLTGELAGLVTLRANLQGKGLNDQPTFSGHFAVDEFVPRKLMGELGIEAPVTADETVLGKAALESDFTATTQRAALENLQAAVDDTKLSGRFAVEDFATTAMKFDLKVDEINLDRYLPPQPEGEQKSSDAGAGASGAGSGQPQGAADPDLIPVETLRGLNLSGKLHIGKLQAYNIKSEQIDITVTAKQGDVRIHPASAQLYGGTYSGDTRIDVRGQQPKLYVEEKLSGVQAQPLFKDAADTDIVSGTANLSAKLRSTGNKLSQIKRGLNGDMAMAFTDGSINGINVPLMIRKASAKLQGQPAPPDEAEKTDFAELTGTATVSNGVVNNKDLNLKSPLLRVDGAGTANLVQEQLDYTVKAVIVASLEGQGGETLEKLKGVPIPVRITGSFSDPKFEVDVAKVLTEQQKERLEKKVDEEKQKLQEKAEEKLQDELKGKLPGLKDLFNR